MKLTRYLKPGQIRLELMTQPPDPAEVPEDINPQKLLWQVKEAILKELVELLEASGKVGNRSKLYLDLLNREKKATTALGGGIAIPHVRSMQARDFAFAFARSKAGLDFGADDQAPVHLFFAVVAPPYKDALYLKVYKGIAEAFGSEETKQALLAADDEHEIIRILSQFGD